MSLEPKHGRRRGLEKETRKPDIFDRMSLSIERFAAAFGRRLGAERLIRFFEKLHPHTERTRFDDFCDALSIGVQRFSLWFTGMIGIRQLIQRYILKTPNKA